jgi:hypothetical protein
VPILRKKGGGGVEGLSTLRREIKGRMIIWSKSNFFLRVVFSTKIHSLTKNF